MHRSLLALVLLTTAACAATAETESAGETQDEIRFSDVESFSVRQNPGFVPPAPEGECRGFSEWTVNMVNRTVQGQGCVKSAPVAAERNLTGEEIGKIRSALFAVKTAKRPAACPTDAPVASLDVTRETRSDRYVEQRSACGSATPVTSESLQALLDLVGELAAAPAAKK